MTETFFEFVGNIVLYGGSAAVIAFGLFVFLGKKWIENKFATKLEEYKSAQNRELEDFRYKINTLFNRVVKIHEKEYEVLPEAWAKLHDAKDYISGLVNLFQTYPDFSRLKEAEIKSILRDYKWKDHQIDELIGADDKNKHFQDRIFWQRLGEARLKFSDFHCYIVRNRIFLSEELKEQFNKADELMWDVLATREVGEEAKDYKMIRESYKKLKENVDLIIIAIEKLVQKRLRYDEAF
ncbi:MAG: hypothetical protein HY891_09960 [Deltaproteobacteria bacterium]|nr:hypothetical protein [Deltaproteobacteria bacterium]